MKILYISQYFPPEMGAPSARVSELARHWVGMGHDVTVLTGFPNHPEGVLAPAYRTRFRKMVCREQWDGVNVVRTWLVPLPNRGSYDRMINYASFAASAAVTGSFLGRPDVVIATSPQLLVGLSGWWVASRNRVPLVFEVRDLWPESLAAVGVGSETSWMYRALARVSRFLYRRSDHIVVVTDAFKEYLVNRCQVLPDKISVVENGVETDLFTPEGSREFRNNIAPDGSFVVSYIGTLGNASGLDTLLDAASMLLDSLPSVCFVLVGAGAEAERLSASIRRRRLKNVRLFGQQPREAVPEIIRSSDVCVVMLKKSDVFRTVIPTKMLEFMACGCPVILAVEGQARAILDAARGGMAIEPENAEELARTIAELCTKRELCQSFGKNGRQYILKNLSRRALAVKYDLVLQRIARGELVPVFSEESQP